MAIKVLLVIIFVQILFCVFTLRYGGKSGKKILLSDADKKEYKLYFMFGTGRFILDHMPRSLVDVYIRKLSVKYRQLYVVNDVKEKCVLYVIEKICESFMFVMVVIIATLLYQVKNPSIREYERIKRPSYDMADEKYNLIADYGEEESLDIVISPKQYSKSEALKIFDERKEKCISKMLGANNSVDEICEDINLSTIKFDDGIIGEWSCECDAVDYDGSVNWNEKLKKNVSGVLILTMSYGEVNKKYIVDINVVPKDDSLQKIVQEYVDSQDKTEAYVELPSDIDDKTISFKKKNDYLWVVILSIGLVYAFLMFFIRDLDVKNKLRSRHEEMVSDYPEILNKFILLLNSGTNNVRALEKIIYEYDKSDRYRYAYEEIKLMINRIRLGQGEEKAYEEYAKRCNEACYSKFAGLLSENLKRGNSNLSNSLNDELNKAWKEKENIMKIRGERIGTNMIFPMVLILSITLVMIIVPAFVSMKGV